MSKKTCDTLWPLQRCVCASRRVTGLGRAVNACVCQCVYSESHKEYYPVACQRLQPDGRPECLWWTPTKTEKLISSAMKISPQLSSLTPKHETTYCKLPKPRHLNNLHDVLSPSMYVLSVDPQLRGWFQSSNPIFKFRLGVSLSF